MSHNPKVDAVKLFALWHGKTPNLEVARELGISVYQLYRLGQRYKLPPRVHMHGEFNRRKAKEEVIVGEEYERRKAAIRARWSDEEREKRRVGPTARPWRLPSYAYDGRVCAFVQNAID
jgi:hypothetical protein